MRLRLNQLGSRFTWATGIEDTFIVDPCPRTGRVMDQYELSEHYARWAEDLDLMRQLGVGAARYGIPWYRVNPAPRRWDWAWIDRVVERLLELGIEPIVDLVHYGTPAWLPRAFLAPEYPQRVAEYAGEFAARFRGRVRCFTPLNEPRIAAWYCGMIGWWPPYLRGWRGFVTVLMALCEGMLRTMAAVRAADAANLIVHADAADLYTASELELHPETALRQHIVFLALDLLSGRVGGEHPLYAWLLQNGATEPQLAWFREHAGAVDVVGFNMYPMFSAKEIVRQGAGTRVRMRRATRAALEALADLYWTRLRRPMMITETAAAGSVRRRLTWLRDSVQAVAALRARGVPVIGYTWWPLFSLIAWAYRQGRRPLESYWVRMGLWDIEPLRTGNLERIRTPLVDAFRAITERGEADVGPLAPPAA